jgi:ankyrin repeat protein
MKSILSCIMQVGRTPLHLVAFSGLHDIAVMLVVHGADVNAIDDVRTWASYTYSFRSSPIF